MTPAQQDSQESAHRGIPPDLTQRLETRGPLKGMHKGMTLTAAGLLLAFMIAAAILSMLISNTSTTLIMMPMAVAVLAGGGIGLVMSLTRLGGYGIGGLLEGVPWVVGAVGLAAAVLGGYLGVRLARRAPDSLIRLLIGLVIIVAGVRLVI